MLQTTVLVMHATLGAVVFAIVATRQSDWGELL